MSIEVLQQAAAAMRNDDDRRWAPVGAWLDRAAKFWGHPELAATGRPNDYFIAVDAARAYLQGQGGA